MGKDDVDKLVADYFHYVELYMASLKWLMHMAECYGLSREKVYMAHQFGITEDLLSSPYVGSSETPFDPEMSEMKLRRLTAEQTDRFAQLPEDLYGAFRRSDRLCTISLEKKECAIDAMQHLGLPTAEIAKRLGTTVDDIDDMPDLDD